MDDWRKDLSELDALRLEKLRDAVRMDPVGAAAATGIDPAVARALGQLTITQMYELRKACEGLVIFHLPPTPAFQTLVSLIAEGALDDERLSALRAGISLQS